MPSRASRRPVTHIIVYKDIVVQSWNTPAGTPGAFGAGLTCDGEAVPPGWEGLHVFDISDRRSPVLVAEAQLACGSHTASAVSDRKNDRLLEYSSPSAHSSTNPNPPATCDQVDIVEVPLDNPEDAQFLRAEPAIHTCHDIGVILGDVLRAACAGGDGQMKPSYQYETSIGEGLNIFQLRGRETRSAIKLGHLNPQTQEFSLDDRRGDDDDDD